MVLPLLQGTASSRTESPPGFLNHKTRKGPISGPLRVQDWTGQAIEFGYIMPPMSPMPPPGAGGGGLSSGASLTIASVVIIKPATDAAA